MSNESAKWLRTLGVARPSVVNEVARDLDKPVRGLLNLHLTKMVFERDGGAFEEALNAALKASETSDTEAVEIIKEFGSNLQEYQGEVFKSS